MNKWVLVVAVAVCLLNSCAGTQGKHDYNPIYLDAKPNFSWSEVSSPTTTCCKPDSGLDYLRIGGSYPEVRFQVSEPGRVRIELLCQDSSEVGTLYDSTITSTGWRGLIWSGHDGDEVDGPNCIFLCRVFLPDTSYVIPYGPRWYPNPYSAGTVVTFSLVDSGHVSIEMYDVTGKHVRHLADSAMYPAGRHQIAWDGLGDSATVLESGLYFYKIFIGDSLLKTDKIVLLK